MSIAKLNAAISAVYQIHGVNSERVISFKDEATQEQRAAAQEIADGWNFDEIDRPVISCSPWQIRKALNQLGLRQQVEEAISASADMTLKDGWEFAIEFRSDDLFVLAMGASIGMNDEQATQFIQYASTL